MKSTLLNMTAVLFGITLVASAIGLFEVFAIPWVGPPVPLAPQ